MDMDLARHNWSQINVLTSVKFVLQDSAKGGGMAVTQIPVYVLVNKSTTEESSATEAAIDIGGQSLLVIIMASIIIGVSLLGNSAVLLVTIRK